MELTEVIRIFVEILPLIGMPKRVNTTTNYLTKPAETAGFVIVSHWFTDA